MSKLRKKGKNGKNAEESSNFHTLIHSFFNCIIFPLYISLLWRCSVQLINTCTEKRIKEFSSRTAASCDSFIFFSPPCLFPFCSRQKNSLKLHVSERREREIIFYHIIIFFTNIARGEFWLASEIVERGKVSNYETNHRRLGAAAIDFPREFSSQPK